MKKILSLILLCAALGTTNANAQTTEEYDFVACCPESGFEANGYWGDEPVYVESVNADASHGGMTGGQTLELYPIVGPAGETFGNRLAGQKRSGSWTYRNAGTWKGLWSQYDRWIAVRNVHPGDELTFTISPATNIQFDDIFMVTEESPAELVNTTEGEERHAIEVSITIDAEAPQTDLVMYSTLSSYIEKLVIKPAGTTAISTVRSVQPKADDTAVYNLAGQRMSAPRGLCIVGGRKVVVR